MLQQLLPRNMTADRLNLADFQCLLVLRQPRSSRFLSDMLLDSHTPLLCGKVKEQIEHIVPRRSVSADLLDT